MKRINFAAIVNTLKSIVATIGSGAKSGVTSRPARYGSNALLSIGAFLGILVILNLIFRNADLRWDLTKNKLYSLSPETVKVIKDIKNDTKIIAFLDPQYGAMEETRRLLEEYRSRNPKISYEILDPYTKIAEAQRYGLTRAGTIIFEQNGKKEEVTTATETEFTSALIKLSTDEKVKVVFWQGNGEKNPESPQPENGYSFLKQSLERLNYVVERQDAFLTDRVATGTGVLVLAGPRTPYSQRQLDAFSNYISGGGKALVMLDPSLTHVQTGLEPILARFGVEVKNGVILDPQAAVRTGEAGLVYAGEYELSTITESLMPTVFPLVQQVGVSNNVPDFLTVEKLAQSSGDSWLETDLNQTQAPTKNVPPDVAGPITMAVSVKQSNVTEDPGTKQRLVIMGDSDLIINQLVEPAPGKQFYVPGNLDLVVNSINWLASRENLVNIVPKDRTQEPVTLNVQQANLVQMLAMYVLPGAVILAGLANWWRRRQRRKKKIQEAA